MAPAWLARPKSEDDKQVRMRVKLRWLMVPLVAGAAYYALFGGEYSLMESRKLERERLRERERLTATRGEVVTLRARADSLQHDSATLERIAREKYGLIKEGERLYRFVDSAHTNAARADTVKPSATH